MTEYEVFEKLKYIFPSPAHVILNGVRNTTGFNKKINIADALIFSVYPSRGIWMSGVEIKVNRSDWKKELANPDKADSIGKYCNYWYLAAPQNIVPLEEVPEPWGFIEIVNNTSKIIKKAPINNNIQQLDINFVCSIMRSFSNSMINVNEIDNLVNERLKKEIKYRTFRLENDYLELKDKVENFESASGIKIKDSWNLDKIGETVKLIVDLGSPEEALKYLYKRMEKVQSALDHMKEILNQKE